MANRKYDIGDVHAPVEDTEVPLSLKLLVLFMIGLLASLGALLGILASGLGLLRPPG
jgi:hypothetical protein